MGIFGGDAQDQVDLDDLKSRVAKLEVAVASLQAQSAAGGVPYGSAAPAAGDVSWLGEVRALLAQDNKIQAIKVYREHTGLGLKEAKDAVEAM